MKEKIKLLKREIDNVVNFENFEKKWLKDTIDKFLGDVKMNSQRKKESDLPMGSFLGTRSKTGEDNKHRSMPEIVENHADIHKVNKKYKK